MINLLERIPKVEMQSCKVNAETQGYSHHTTSLSPELMQTADGLRAAQLGVQVVVDSSHLSDSYPVLAFERQPERPPAQVGRHVQNEARHVGQLDAAYIPGRTKATLVVCV